MKELLSQRERDKVIARVKKQKFLTSRKNVAPWCMQWIALFFSAAWITPYFLNSESGWTRNLLFGLAWLVIAMLSHNQWERYKEQSILKQMLDESSEQNDGQLSSESALSDEVSS